MEAPFALEAIGAEIAGRYRVEQLLGRGGMAAVYRVSDDVTGHKLALKRGWARNTQRLQKCGALLEREYHILAQLAHPGIIEVYDYGVDQRGPYYTMELLEGADAGKGERMAWRRVCAVLYDVASSLAILHSRGLVHRDVSARNVRYTLDGRAKLIDFGAMVSMGVAKEVVGTPPFMAPEVLQMQALDARSDLFSLGALGYYLLTGRHAYAARQLSDLRDAWRSRPQPPSRAVAGLPAALNALIMQLLAIDRSGRPRSAGEVMERLSAVAELPCEVGAAVSRAYLTTPLLVGREQALIVARKQMLSLARSDGAVLFVRGVAGSGRSRMLDACALEGKLLGATVVRADASDGSSGEWSVARALGSQLLALLPEKAAEAARLSRHVLGQFFEGLRDDETPTSATPPERSLLIRELRDFVLRIAASTRLVLVIDDADRIDEPSAALIAALAHKTERHALLLAVAVDSENEHEMHGPLRLLRDVAEAIELEHLASEQTETLMRSVFGDIANLPTCAGRIHDLSHGNPRAAMELAQHLVDRGLARYEAGSWSLPAELKDGDLPSTLAASLLARVARIGDDARELVDALALADRDRVQTDSYALLTSHGDPRRMFKALDELVAARILVADTEHYYFAQRGTLVVLQEAMPEVRRVALHSRLADLLGSTGGDVVQRGRHLFGAQRDLEAIELLRSINLLQRLPPLDLLTTLVERAERHRLPPRTLQELRIALLSKASVVMAVDSFRRWAPIVLSQLEQDSGLSRYRALGQLPEPDRLKQALAETQQSYLATPEHERVHSVLEAIRELARLAAAVTSLANPLYDLELIESLPSLAPLAVLSPALGIVAKLIEASKEVVAGTGFFGIKLYQEVLARIAEPDRGGLDDAQHARTRMGLEYGIATLEAAQGVAVEQRVQVLEKDREFRVNAWRVRMVMHLNQGNTLEARTCGRRAELLQLQEGIEERYAASTIAGELLGYASLGDLLGIKSKLDMLTTLAAQHPTWRSILLYAQARYRQLQGNLPAALEAIVSALELVRPVRHGFYCWIAAAHVDLLEQLGLVDEAAARAREYVAIADREPLILAKHVIYLPASQSLARAGEHAEALRLIDWSIELSEQLGRGGYALGRVYEARARIASYMQDSSAFDRFAERCMIEYQRAGNPSLEARMALLIEQTRRVFAGEIEPSTLMSLPARPLAAEPENEYETIHSRMLECVDQSDRGRCALTLLLQTTVSCAGYLFGVAEGGLTLLAALPDTDLHEELSDWLDRYVQAELSCGETMTNDADATQSESLIGMRYTDSDGRCFEAIPLTRKAEGQHRMVAVLAMQLAAGPLVFPPKELCAEIASSLFEHGDVPGVVLGL